MEGAALLCGKGRFGISGKTGNKDVNSYRVHGARSSYILDSHDKPNKKILEPHRYQTTLDVWYESNKIFDKGDVKNLGVPSIPSCNIARGLLKAFFKFERSNHTHSHLCSLETYGIEWTHEFYGTDWETRATIHILGVDAATDSDKQDTLLKDRASLGHVFAKLFADDLGEYPPFMKGWAILLSSWTKGQHGFGGNLLLQDPCWWPWSTRLNYFDKLYMTEIGADDRRAEPVRLLVQDPKVCGPSAEWESNIRKGSPMDLSYEHCKAAQEKYGGVITLYDVVRGTVAHVHTKEMHSDDIEFKNVLPQEEHLLNLKQLEYEILSLNPQLLHQITLPLHKAGIHL